ncbi:MAG: adenylate/guanylate cyclase domain-containing protein [Verrucomicrobia bacterium]|nr:MAG: adenylate/guanylate cyclase domain-containing protein [Verrucomicrobiota bacterium]
MERRLAAVLAADVVGYSRLMGTDEAGTLDALTKVRGEFIDSKIAEHQGRTVKVSGDGLLLEFPSVVNAVRCAAEIQRGMRDRNTNVPQERRIEFRIGVNLGDVIVQDGDIFGDGVNVAARLERIAKPGGIAISGSVRDQIGNRLDLVFEDMGEHKLKNIEQPVRVYSLSQEESTIANTAPNPDQRPSIAVLPFSNMSGDPEQEYFSDGITEDIITDLSKISGLWVAARNTVFTYKGKPVKVEQIARDLGVAYILEGSVRKAGARVRVTGQLISAKDGGHLWADRFDRDLTDIFAIQDEITRAIVEQLTVKLLPQEKKSIERPQTDNIEAYTYYLRGREFLHRHTKSYYQVARRMFTKAIELDPRYARAYAGIAACDSFLFYHYFQYETEEAIENIMAATGKALELDDGLAEAHACRGVALTFAKRFEEAETELERAIALDPNSFEAHYFYARYCFVRGELGRAAALFERAGEVKPDDYQSWCLLIHVYRSLGRTDKIEAAARKGIALAEKELALHPENPRPAALGAAGLLAIGETERAREWLARALAIDPDDLLTLYNAACSYAHLGEADRALDLLERFIPLANDLNRAWIKHDSDFDSLRGHPRFQKILEQIG